MSFSTAYYAFAYYAALFAFGVVAVVVNAGCLLMAWWPASVAAERVGQRIIHRSVACLVWLVGVLRVVRVEYRGFDRIPPGGAVMVANHPGLADAPYLLARVPHGVCIFKPAIRRNPLFGAAMCRAGYLSRDGQVGMIRAAAGKVRAGATLVVFPEGTRSPAPGTMGAFHRGFALIARLARVPVQLVRIECDVDMLTRAHPWWKLPPLPARVVVKAGPSLDAGAASSASALVAAAEAWLRSAPTEFDPCPATTGAGPSAPVQSQPARIPRPLSSH